MAPSRSGVRRLLALGLLVAASNCTDELPTQPTAQTIAAAGGRTNVLAVVSGNNQSGPVGTALAAPLVVRLTHNGKAVKSNAVTFTVTAGGGQVAPATGMTDAQGQARATWTLGTVVGSGSVTASTPTASSVTFTSQAVAGPPTQFIIVSGNNQTGVAGSQLVNPLVVRVSDAYGNRVSNTQVAFAVTGGSGSVGTPNPVSDANGEARTAWTLGTIAGPNAAKATLGALTPLVFAATGTPGTPAQLAIVSGDGQTAIAGSPLAQPIAVGVSDANGNPNAGVNITFTVTGGNGSVSSGSVVTNAAGLAATGWTLGTTAGANAVQASAAGLTPVSFSATGVVGPPTQLVKVSGDGQSALVGTALPNPLVVRAADANGNGVDGETVLFKAASGGGSVANSSVTTSGGGLASTALTLGPTPGANMVTADASGLSSTLFNATALVGPPAQIAIVSGNNQTAIAGQTLGTPLVVRVSDALGNRIQGATVVFAVTAGGGSITPTSVSTDAQGLATTSWTLGPTAGANQVSATVTGVPSVLFSATATPPPLVVTVVGGSGQSGLVGSTLPASLVVQVSEPSADPKVPGPPAVGVTVHFVVVQGGGAVSPATAVTDAQGNASTVLTLGQTVGTNEVQAQVPGGTTTPSFIETALPPLVIVSGDNQTGGVGLFLPQPIVVSLGGGGSGLPPVTLSFTVLEGGGSVSRQSVQTDTHGTAENAWTLGAAAGPNAVQVAVPAFPQIPPVTFHATGVAAGAPTRLVIISGNDQTGGAGFELPNPLDVQVQDEHGLGVPGITVTFAVTAGGGSIASPTVTSDAGGHARTTWTLGPNNGPNAVEAAASGLTPVTFNATGITPLILGATGGQKQVGIVGTVLPEPLTVQTSQRPVDPQSPPGPPVSGVTITFTVIRGGGTLSNATAVTGPDGIASVNLTLGGTPGDNSVQATAPGADTPVTFDETAAPSGPYSIGIVSGNFQSGIVGTALAQPLQVRVADAIGAPLSGVAVTFAPSNGSVDAPNAVTDVDGTASTGWTLGGVLQQTVTASVAGLPDVRFSALGAPRLAVYSGDQQTGGVNAPLPQPVVVRLTDLNGNPVGGVPVTFTVTGGGGTVTPAQATSTSAGLAQATWTLGANPGANALVARYPNPPPPFGPVPVSVSFTATGVVAGPPDHVVILSGNGQTGGNGATLPTPLVVQVIDASGIGVEGITVNFAANDGGTAAPNATTSDNSGRASTSWTLGPGTGQQTLTATATGLPAAAFNATAVAPTALILRSPDGQRPGAVGSGRRPSRARSFPDYVVPELVRATIDAVGII